MTEARNFIGGEWVEPAGGETLPMIAPSDGQRFAEIARGTAADIDAAVGAARAAFEGRWGATPAFERGRLLAAMSRRILQHGDELAELEAKDTGKPMKQARNDIEVASRYFEFYAGAADKIHGETVPFLTGFQVMILREPRGVTGHIIPWNYPAQMFARTVASTLAAGNAAVIKPAEEACMSCLRMTEYLAELGLPSGVLNLVTGLGEEAGAALSGHPGIDLIAFTGSPAVGTLVQTAAAQNHLPCILELGGKSPQVIFEDADLDRAADVTIAAIVQNAGQTCSAGSRALVQETIYETFTETLAARFAALDTGPHDLDLDCGPLISAAQKQRVETYLARAAADNIETLATGRLDERAPRTGYYVPPTLLDRVPPTHALAREEIFGPVLAAISFTDEDDAIRIANATDFGLVAGVWTENGGRQMRVAKAIRAGQVFVNGYGAGGGVELPFGGFRHSGYGREKGLESLREYTVAKTVIFNHLKPAG